MQLGSIRWLPGHKTILVVAAAAALALGGFAIGNANAPSASAQCFYCGFNNGYNNGFYGGYNNGFYGGYNSYLNPYFNQLNPFYSGYSNSLYGYNGYNSLYGYNGLYNYPNYNYNYVYPSVATYAAPTTATTVAYTAPVTTTTVATPNYSIGGSYCNLKAGGQVWVPSGASPAAYGC